MQTELSVYNLMKINGVNAVCFSVYLYQPKPAHVGTSEGSQRLWDQEDG